MKKIFVVLTIFFIFTLSSCGETFTFELLGDENVFLHVGDNYIDEGVIAKDGGVDLSKQVDTEGFVDTTLAGDYQIMYMIKNGDQSYFLTRNIFVRDIGCEAILDTNVTKCDSYWSAYLHTSVKLTIYYNDDKYHNIVPEILDNVENILRDYHQLSTKYDDYGIENVYAINNSPSKSHILDERLFTMIDFALVNQQEVIEQFNVALGPVIDIWHNYREQCNNSVDSVCLLPSDNELNEANLYTDPSKIILNNENLSVTMSPYMKIDLGGLSKGYISREIVNYLDTLDISYLFNNGSSNISIGGSHPIRENGKYLLAITNPSNPQSWYAEVFLSDGDQLVTSGDYQQYYKVDESVYHHIINPTTLYPMHYFRSVSLVYNDAALADLYSTALFNMSIDDGLEFVNSHDGLEAIWYTLDGKAVFSDNFESKYLYKLYVPKDK